MKLFFMHVAILFFAFLIQSCDQQAESKFLQTKVSSIDISIDERIELLTIMQLLGGWEDVLSKMIGSEIPRSESIYRKNIDEKFLQFKSHPSIKTILDLQEAGFSFDAPVGLMLHLTRPPELKPLVEIPQYYLDRAGGKEKIEIFIAAVRKFYLDTEFSDFYKQNKSYYESVIAKSKETSDLSLPEKFLKDFYGQKDISVSIVFTPVFPYGNFGPRFKDKIISVISPNGLLVDKGIQVFNLKESYSLLVHEASHSLVDTESQRKNLQKVSYLLDPIKEKMSENGNAYGNWDNCFEEHVIRAIELLYALQVKGEKEMLKKMDKEKELGFIYIEEIFNSIKEYDSNRGKFKKFEDFYKKLVEDFCNRHIKS